MKSPDRVPIGATGRADLLRALAISRRDVLLLDVDADGWFGYVRSAESKLPVESAAPPHAAPRGVVEDDDNLPLKMPWAYAIADRRPRSTTSEETPTPATESRAAPIDEDAPKARSPVRQVAFDDLVPQARLMPALRRHLGATRAGSLDLDRIIGHLAARTMPRHLPRRCFQRWHPELVVVLDFCPRLWPYREDMHRLAQRLLRHCGRSGVSLRIVNHGPLGPWSDWVAHQNPHLKEEPPRRPWAMPAPGTPVLIASDLGLLRGPTSAPCQAWQRFIAGLRRAQLRPLALRHQAAAFGADLNLWRAGREG